VSTTPGGEGAPHAPPPPTPQPSLPSYARAFSGRSAFAIAQIYYYAAAIVGVGFAIGGAIGLLIGLRQLVLPADSDTTRDSVRLMLQGAAWGVPGSVFAWWHLGEARSREGRVISGAFWGRSLYFHLVSFAAGVTVLGAVTAGLYALIDAALPQTCVVLPTPLSPGLSPGVGPGSGPGLDPGLGQIDVSGFCTDASDSLRSAANALIVILVAGVVWWWHLREARRTPAVPAAAI
jgi:hypothetical protein